MSKNLKLILGALVIVVFAVLVWFFVLSPVRGDIADTEAAIDEEQQLLVSARAQLAKAEVTKEEGKVNQAKLLELAKMMPASEELPSLLLQIQDLADQAGIDFITITPGVAFESPDGGYQILPLDLEFEGSFFDVNDFVYRAEEMVAGPGRLLAVKTLDVSAPTGTSEEESTGDSVTGSPSLQVGITMYAFIMGGSSATTPSGGSGSSPSTSGSTDTTESSTEQ